VEPEYDALAYPDPVYLSTKADISEEAVFKIKIL
jgi:hypothetical protein